MPDPLALTALEVAVGTALGSADVPALHPDTRTTPRAALEAVVTAGLQRPPCLVAFSGGRDSSVVLAVATAVARRAGLELPVPVTQVFPDVADSDETTWQQAVIAHLGLSEWMRLRWTDELDVVGPYARRAFDVVGPYAPANLHFLLPVLDLARGGSVLSGSGGDELFGLSARPVAARIRQRPLTFRPRDARRLVSDLAPFVVRRRNLRRHDDTRFEWLLPEGQHDFALAFSDWIARVPLRYDVAICDWLWRSRMVQHGLDVYARLGRTGDVTVVNPFEHAAFLAAFAGLAGVVGTGGRGRSLQALVGDLLPVEVLARTSKAGFGGAFVTDRVRRTARNITPVANPFVDDDALRRAWRQDQIRPQALVLLQEAVSARAAPA